MDLHLLKTFFQHHNPMMKLGLYFALSLGAVLTQATISTSLSFHGIYPDFCLVLICLAGLLSNEYKGLLVGMMIGLFQDLLAPGGIGLNMILKGLVGALAGITSNTISRVTISAVLVVTLALSFGCGLTSLIVAYSSLTGSEAVQAISLRLIPQSLYHSLLAAGLFWMFTKVRRSLGMVQFAHERRQ